MPAFNVGTAMGLVALLHEVVGFVRPRISVPTFAMMADGWLGTVDTDSSRMLAIFFHAMGLQMAVIALLLHSYSCDARPPRPPPLAAGWLLCVGGLVLGLAMQLGPSGFLLVAAIGAYIVYANYALRSSTAAVNSAKAAKKR